MVKTTRVQKRISSWITKYFGLQSTSMLAAITCLMLGLRITVNSIRAVCTQMDGSEGGAGGGVVPGLSSSPWKCSLMV